MGLVTDRTAPTACWLHPAVEVRGSAIEGRGLFAGEPIGADQAVSRLGGLMATDDELATMFGESPGYIDTISVSRGTNLVLPPGVPNRFGNHSCDPNLWWADAFTLAMRRDIDTGEELTNDYGTCTDDATFRMDCRCGSVRCRDPVTGRDWQLPGLQQRYGKHWVPVLLERIADR